VTKDADIGLLSFKKRAPFFCELPALEHDMTYSDAEAGQLDHSFWRKPALFVPIDITGYRRDRSNRAKLLNDRASPDIASMNNVIDRLEMAEDGWIKQTVGVGNDADAKRS